MIAKRRLSDLTQAEVATAAEALRTGQTWVSVCDSTGLNPSTLHYAFRKYGFEHRRPWRKTRAMTISVPTDPGVLGYMAGIMDGEGSIVWLSKDRSWVACVTNTDQRLLDYFLDVIGETMIEIPAKVSGGVASRKPAWRWTLHRQRDVLAFLVAIEPYLLIKRDKACAAIAFLQSKLEVPTTLSA